MKRHVLPRAALSLLCVLVAIGGVRAQADDPPRPEPPTTDRPAGGDPVPPVPGEIGTGTGTGTGAGAAGAEAQPAVDGEQAAPTQNRPPAVGEAFPGRLPLSALPKSGTEAPAAEGDQGVALATFVGEQPRPVIFVFWSSRCPVCARYGEVLQKLSESLGDRVALVLVASGAEETPEAVRKARDAGKLRLPIWLDADRRAAVALGVRVTPTAFLVDAAGVLRYRGPIDDDRRARSRDARELLRPAAEAVLEGKAVETGEIRAFGSSLR